jgi:hypothetical protein
MVHGGCILCELQLCNQLVFFQDHVVVSSSHKDRRAAGADESAGRGAGERGARGRVHDSVSVDGRGRAGNDRQGEGAERRDRKRDVLAFPAPPSRRLRSGDGGDCFVVVSLVQCNYLYVRWQQNRLMLKWCRSADVYLYERRLVMHVYVC